MRCKECKDKFEPKYFNQKFCMDKDECIKRFAEQTKMKVWQEKKTKMKAELMTVQDYIKIAQTHFNNYIRQRDKGNLCISCKKPPKKENAGHFYSAGGHYNVRFDEDNVHLQCEHCNTFLSGNLIPYRANLIKKIGIEKFENLESIANNEAHHTIDELKMIIKIYKAKVKAFI